MRRAPSIRTLFFALAAASLPLGASAATYTVDSAGDFISNCGIPGQCTLRTAVAQANFNPASDKIFIPNDVGTIAIGSQMDIAPGGLTITGLDTLGTQKRPRIDGQDITRHFEVEAGAQLVLEWLHLEDGRVAKPATIPPDGGAVLNHDTLTVRDCYVSGSRAEHGGAVFAQHDSTLTVEDSLFWDNSAVVRGGAIGLDPDATGTITDSTLRQNSAPGGGALAVGGAIVTVSGSHLYENTATDGGSIHLISAILDIDDSTVHDSSATDDGGAVHATDSDLYWTATDVYDNDASDDGGAMYLDDSPLTLMLSDLFDNQAGGHGGALYTVTAGATLTLLSYAALWNNTALAGAAVSADGGTLELTDSYVLYNSATSADMSDPRAGGAVVYRGSDGRVTRTAFFQNDGHHGAGLTINYPGDVDPKNKVIDSHFIENTATVRAGALWLRAPTPLDETEIEVALQIGDTRFIGNTAERGGAIVTHQSFRPCGDDADCGCYCDPQQLFCTCQSVCHQSGYCYQSAGCAIFDECLSHVLLVERSSFHLNEASQDPLNTEPIGSGGAILNAMALQVINTTFAENAATTGGAIAQLYTSFPNESIPNLGLSHVTLVDNQAVNYGGGLSTRQGHTKAINTIIDGNTAPIDPQCHRNAAPAGHSRAFTGGHNLVVAQMVDCLEGGAMSDQMGPADLDTLVTSNPPHYPLLPPPAPPITAHGNGDCTTIGGVTLLVDQLGNARNGVTCDVGAIETP